MTIKQLLEMPIGKEHRTGGYELTVRTSRHPREVDGRKLQSVILEDETGKINADVLVKKNYLQNSYPLHVIIGWLQPSPNKDQKELYVDQWYTRTQTPDEYEAKQQKKRQAGLYRLYDDENGPDIPGMCATHIIEGFINGYTAKHGEVPECTPERMKIINKWVAFNMDGRMAGPPYDPHDTKFQSGDIAEQ